MSAALWFAVAAPAAAQAPHEAQAEPRAYQAFCQTRDFSAGEQARLTRLVHSVQGRLLPDRFGDRAGLLLFELPPARLPVFQRDIRRFKMLRSTPVEVQRKELQVRTCRFLVEFEGGTVQEAASLLRRLGFEIRQYASEYQRAFVVRKSIDPRKAAAELMVLKQLPGVAYAVHEVLLRSSP